MTRVAGRPSPASARLVWAIAAVGVAVIGVLVASYAQETAGATPSRPIAAVSLVGSLLAFIVSGALIVSRQPRNIVGWLLMIPGLALPASTLATNWLGSMPPPTQVTPPIWLVIWALSWSWILLIFPIFHLLLTFPDGRLLSPRWRWAVALEVAMVAVFLGFTAFKQSLNVLVNDISVWTVPNPIGFLPNNLFDAALGSDLGLWASGHDDRERGGRRAPVPPRVDDGAPAAEVAGAGGRPVRGRLRRLDRCTPAWSATGRSCSGSRWRGSRSRSPSPCSATGCTRSTTSSAGPSRGR